MADVLNVLKKQFETVDWIEPAAGEDNGCQKSSPLEEAKDIIY